MIEGSAALTWAEWESRQGSGPGTAIPKVRQGSLPQLPPPAHTPPSAGALPHPYRACEHTTEARPLEFRCLPESQNGKTLHGLEKLCHA